MTRVCICQICNCGRHKCPHKPRGAVSRHGPCELSEYTNKYRSHPLNPPKPIRPSQEPHGDTGPMEDRTTHRVDYIKHPLEKPFVHEGDRYRTPEGDMDMTTNYTKDYIKKPCTLTKPIKREHQKKIPGKFQGDPTYRTDYQRWAIDRRPKITHDSGYQAPEVPFQGNSHYDTDYIPHKIAMRQSLKPAETARGTDAPFDDKTGYRDEYIKHPIPPKEMRQKEEYSPNKAPLDGLSNYKRDYVPKEVGKTDSCKPDANAYQSEAPFEDDTTHRIDYKKWKAERPFVHEPEQYSRPEGDMDHNTTTHTDYTRKPLARTSAKKPDQRKLVPGKFDGVTNYREDFQKWNAGPRPKQTMKSEYSPPDAPFEGQSHYDRDYIPHQSYPRRSMKPAENSRLSSAPLDDRTGYRDHYIRHPIPPREMRAKEEYSPNKAPLEGLSNYKSDYIPKQAFKTDSCKPDANAYQSEAPFEDDTTHRVDYKKWKADRPYVHEPEQYSKPEGDMDHNTTTHTDYTKKPLTKREPKRPSSVKKVPGKFNGATNYREDFRGWTPGDRPRPTMKSEYNPPGVPFEGSSNYQTDYIPHRSMPPHSLKPADKGATSDAPFEDGTEYRTEYIKRKVLPCPAVIVDNPNSMYRFKEQDPEGHKWYQPISTSVTALPQSNAAGVQQQLTALSVA